ncbi:MAG: DUF6587 family protein [Burkholderiaceae bacterium]
MSPTIQGVLVAMIVAVATVYASIKFMPGAWRRSLAARAAALVARWGVSEVNARRVEAKLSSGGACGSCETCKACATPVDAGDAIASPPNTFRQIPIRSVSR